MSTKKFDSSIIWRGPSLLTGEPILVLLVHASGNTKTGPMSQTYILRADMTPIDALRQKDTSAICGNCTFKQNGCYAERSKGLIAISERATRGTHARPYADISLQEACEQVSGKLLRIGAYGDPAAVPTTVWEQLCYRAASWTGYTHQWRTCDQTLSRYCMASCDTFADAIEARASGWRYFRVRQVHTGGAIEPTLSNEVVCPASHERDLTTCADCQLCKGNAKSARSVAIIDHSSRALSIRRARADLHIIQ